MKKTHVIGLFVAIFALTNCSKDILKKYDKRIIGTWRIADVDRYGLGGNIDNLPFIDGSITFNEDGTLSYVNSSNSTFTGTWDIVKKTTDNGTVHSLIITAVNYNSIEVLSQYYDDMNFTGTDRFRATAVAQFHSYVTIFRR